jgi:hypothetical protein
MKNSPCFEGQLQKSPNVAEFDARMGQKGDTATEKRAIYTAGQARQRLGVEASRVASDDEIIAIVNADLETSTFMNGGVTYDRIINAVTFSITYETIGNRLPLGVGRPSSAKISSLIKHVYEPAGWNISFGNARVCLTST